MKWNNIKYAAAFAAALTGLYFITRFGFPALYTTEWGARHFFWPVAIIMLLPALFGKFRFSAISLA